MINLNLPTFEPELKSEADGLYIKDIVRRKFVKLTPEEWVRQHFINYLVAILHYPKTKIRTEIGMKYSQRQKRADVIVFDTHGEPYMIVECKSFEIPINANTLLQISSYQSVMKAKFLVLTNGIVHLYYRIMAEKFIQIAELPAHSKDNF